MNLITYTFIYRFSYFHEMENIMKKWKLYLLVDLFIYLLIFLFLYLDIDLNDIFSFFRNFLLSNLLLANVRFFILFYFFKSFAYKISKHTRPVLYKIFLFLFFYRCLALMKSY